MTQKHTKNWRALLIPIVKNYNNTYHKGIKETPNNAFDKKHTRETMRMKYTKPKFKTGDKVRVAVQKNKKDIVPSARSYLFKWSKEIATIIQRYKSPNGVYFYRIQWGTLGGRRSLHLIPEYLLQKA